MSRMDVPPIESGRLSSLSHEDDDDLWEVHPEEMATDGEVCVRDVMTPAVGVISPDATVQQAAQLMRDLDVGPVPVCEGRTVVGMVTDRDLAVRVVAPGFDSHQTRVRDVMSTDIVCASENDRVVAATQLMKDMQVRRIPVVDGGHQIRGIVSLADVAVRQGNDQLSAEVLRHLSERGPGEELRVL